MLPEPSEYPDADPDASEAVHENVVPAVELDKEIDVVPPVQIVCEDNEAVTLGIGFTVIDTVMGAPIQPLEDGVMV